MLDATPTCRFKLSQFNKFVLVVLLVSLNNIENDVVVFVQEHEQNSWQVNIAWRVNAGLI
jgi:hypothetical protein